MTLLLERRHWVFDLDGTLTAAVHDFDAIRAELGLPAGRPILEALAEFPPERADEARERVHAWEIAHLDDARPEPDAVALLEHLRGRGARLGVLTRNSAGTAWATLRRVGMDRYFGEGDVVGRDCAAPKPAPDGVRLLLDRWDARPHDAVMVGDYLFDLLAGRAAGVATVFVDRDDERPPWSSEADRVVRRLDDLLATPLPGSP